MPWMGPFATIEAFCIAGMPFGLGYEKSAIDAIIDERRNTQARAAAIAQQNVLTFPGRPPLEELNKGVDNTFIEEGGRGATNADYLLARVRRDAPEVFERVQADPLLHVISLRALPVKPCTSLLGYVASTSRYAIIAA